VLEREFGKDAFTNVLDSITRMLKPKSEKSNGKTTIDFQGGAGGELSLSYADSIDDAVELSPTAAMDLVEKQLSQCTDVEQRIQLVEGHLKALATLLQELKQEKRRKSAAPTATATATDAGTAAAVASASAAIPGNMEALTAPVDRNKTSTPINGTASPHVNSTSNFSSPFQ
jgi:hypothetical protein